MTNQERIQANNTELQECIELAESLPDAGGSTTTPDWNQNDPTQPDYIANRTHWSEMVEAPVEFDGDLTGREYYDMSGGEGMGFLVKVSDALLTAEDCIDSTMIIKHKMMELGDATDNETEFTITEELYQTIMPIDESNYIVAVLTPFEIPVMMIVYGDVSPALGVQVPEGTYFVHMTTGEGEYIYGHSISCITSVKEVVHKIDEKYLPNINSEDDAIIPKPTTSDNGKFLQVLNGVATWVTIYNAEEATF